ncbi:MAG: S46 family peptidase [Bacteroidales bacterium]|nr:S46 family peptidase [Bacteroidales bacterium]
MRKLSLFIIAWLFVFQVFADEGMWLLTILGKKYSDLQKAGLKLSAEDIYNVNRSSLKDAIVQFGNGCTGEIISKQGLLLTNHHCGYGQIQYHSTVENDYLTNGFWAKSYEQELPNPDLFVSFLVRIEDVTSKVLSEVTPAMSEKERQEKIQKAAQEIVKEAKKDNHYQAIVRDFFGGNQYLLMIYEVFNDVRLVGTPPSSIGKFGGDTDNWMWPRHTGDFCLFRVYADKNNKPARYSKDNVPFTPKHSLPISLAGVRQGDFVMIMGFPGRTQRYMTSWGVQEAIDRINPSIVKIREKKLAIYKEEMNKDPKVRIQYASKYARTSNYWKYFIGQTKGLKRLRVIDTKRKQETEFAQWVMQSKERQDKYGQVLKMYEEAYQELKDYNLFKTYASEAGNRGVDILAFASRFQSLHKALESDTTSVETKKRIIDRLKQETDNYYKDFHRITDQKVLAALIEMFANDISPAFLPSAISKIKKDYKGKFDKFSKDAFDVSIFRSKDDVMAYLTNPTYNKLDKDPIFALSYSISGAVKRFDAEFEKYREMLQKAERLYIAGLMEMFPNKIFYPDANSTMRLTYGHVLPYQPADGIFYDYYTTLDGIIEKEDSTNSEFIVPKKLKELWKNKDYGSYAENGVIRTCFLSNTDITGGNSGSPVINAKGELVGLAFDGNWEAMSGDIAFEPALQRTISVDIRYVLFIIDKFAGAQNLIQELQIIRN